MTNRVSLSVNMDRRAKVLESQFQTSCDDYINFPCNLLQKDLFQHSLDAYTEKLKDEEGDYFQKKRRTIFFWDLVDRQDSQWLLRIRITSIYEG